MDNGVLLDVVNVSKAFPGVQALDKVSFTLRKGSVHAVCGENGAGKSTLMNILIGMYTKDEGEIYFKGKRVNFDRPKQALDAGISIIEQELTPIRHMTIAENMFLGREPVRFRFINYAQLNRMATDVLAELGVGLDPSTMMKELSLAEVQMVEIAKAISHDSDVIIMDEPTSAIGEQEVDNLFRLIRIMKDKGKGIIYVSHRLKEVFTIADEVTVLRDGKYITTKNTKDIEPVDLVSYMIGRKAEEDYVKETLPTDSVLIEIRDFTSRGTFENIALTLKKGEILGIFGLLGSGRSEFLNALFGVTRPENGVVLFENRQVRITSPKDALELGIALVPEDRKNVGLYPTGSVKENISLASLRKLTNLLFINEKEEKKAVSGMIDKFHVRTPTIDQLVRYLSGGNQQKVVLGRCFLTKPRVLLLDEPTRGIDVGAKREIYKFMADFVGEGNGIIMVSSELPEILSMSDRIVVFRKGAIAGILDRNEASQERLLQLAS
jgi:ABC-type sugar transport system ATPase subunit